MLDVWSAAYEFYGDLPRDGCSRQELPAQVPADKEMLFHQTMAEGRYR